MAETFASEVPAIVTQIPNNSSWHKQATIQHMREAYFIPAKNKHALVEAIVYLYKHPEIRELLVKQGKRWPREHNRIYNKDIQYCHTFYCGHLSFAKPKNKLT